jgi:hypothetical protein
MAVEPKRGCGYREIGGTYLVGSGILAECDRIPMPLPEACPCCNGGIKHTRTPRKIDALKLWGEHEHCTEGEFLYITPVLTERRIPSGCYVCHPTNDTAYIMGVGENHYPKPQDFVEEAVRLGVSKRIPAVPRDVVVGKTKIFLTHKRALQIQTKPGEKEKWQAGVIYAFVVTAVEQIVKQSEYESQQKALAKRGIKAVAVPDNDPDHQPKKKNRAAAIVKNPAEGA